MVFKRSLDVVVSAAAVLLGWPVFLVIAVLVKLDSRGPVLFTQTRVGRGFRPFAIYKFRTMAAESSGRSITVRGDARITRIGRVLRITKLDELPQLFNVLKGDMSLVGPRPEVPAYVTLFETEYRRILSVRPGLTDLSSLKYQEEERLLAEVEDPEREYVTRILPDKLELARQYIDRATLWTDVAVIMKTFTQIAGRRVPS